MPLSPLAVDLLERAIALADAQAKARTERLHLTEWSEPEWLFSAPHGPGPITPESVNHALRKALKPRPKARSGNRQDGKATGPAIALKNIVPHDLRRTAASMMTSLGINRLVVSKVLNHVETGVTAIYDRHGYDVEKRHALEAWAAHLEAVVSGKPKAANVVQMTAAGAG